MAEDIPGKSNNNRRPKGVGGIESVEGTQQYKAIKSAIGKQINKDSWIFSIYKVGDMIHNVFL